MMWWFWIFIASLVSSGLTVVVMAMMSVASESDRAMERTQNENCNKTKCNGSCAGWNICEDKW